MKRFVCSLLIFAGMLVLPPLTGAQSMTTCTWEDNNGCVNHTTTVVTNNQTYYSMSWVCPDGSGGTISGTGSIANAC